MGAYCEYLRSVSGLLYRYWVLDEPGALFAAYEVFKAEADAS